VEITPVISSEWHERHVLSCASLAWLREHADPGDRHPIVTAVGLLRAEISPGR
jgi:hypothetical protein